MKTIFLATLLLSSIYPKNVSTTSTGAIMEISDGIIRVRMDYSHAEVKLPSAMAPHALEGDKITFSIYVEK